jgi:hypothetical protein
LQNPPINLKEGTPVKVSSKDHFIGYKLGFFLRRCKKDNGYIVYLTNPEYLSYREMCIIPDRGDTIVPIVKVD